MISKKDLVNNLKNVKVVIGNDFDLHCGLKSKYSDYFNYYKEKYGYIKQWIISFGSEVITKRFIGRSFDEIGGAFKNFDDVNVWDFIFEIISDDENKDFRWCDIEDAMIDCLTEPHLDKMQVPNQKLSLTAVYKAIQNPNVDLSITTPNFFALVTFIKRKVEYRKFSGEEEYFEFLLNELRKFEINFGKYLMRQHDYFDGFVNHHNSDYDHKAKDTLCILSNIDNIVSIDSFNYGSFNDDKLDALLRNINGNLDMPIFGIDTTRFRNDDARSIFSKTNRRMELDMLVPSTYENKEFENVVVFGHSLSKNDYSFFFPLLDKLEMTNFSSNKKIVFAFSVFDEKHSYIIKSNHRKAINSLFASYAAFKGYQNEPERLLDALTTQGRILSFEVPHIANDERYFFD